MKRILTLLLVFVMVMQISVFCVSAAEVNVTYKGMDYSAGTPSQKSESDGRVMTRPANPLGWKVTLPYKTSALKLTYSTGEKENGVLNVRLGSSTGEIIGSIETDILAPTWATYTHVISLSKSLVGNQDIWITISKGSVGPGGGHWIDSLTFLKDSNAQPFATLEIADAYKDIKDDPNVHEINMLTELGVFSDSDISFMPDKPMKRAEFACGLGKLLDAQKYATEVSPFKDVKEGTDEADILSGLYQAGIIKGDTDGNFRPTSYITPLEASIVCLNALGYEGFAKDQNTVLDLANTLKLFDGIKLTNKVTKSQGAKLIYNLLLADYLAVNEMSDKEIFYNPTKNYLENSTDYIHAKGVVTANAYTKLYAPKKSEGISIDGISYKLGDGVNGSYLGVRCEFFYHEEDGEKVIDVIRPLPKVKWNYVESTTDIDFTKISEKKVEYTIISEDEEYEYELDKNTAIIYNGVALTKSLGLLISDPADFEGSITMIDNDSDDILDAIWIDHVSRVIEIGFVSNGRIKDELATNPQYSIYDTNLKDFVVFKGGRPALPDELASGTVLTLYESSESGKEQFVRAIADENIVTGTITSFSNGKYTIDGKEYRVSSLCNDDLYVGQTGKFVLDRYDFIIACEEEANSEFMSGLYLASDGGEATALEKEANIKLLTKAGIEIFTVAQKVIVDGVTIKTVKDFNERVNPTAVEVKSPVLYRINANNQITVLDTINDGTYDRNDQLTNLFAMIAEEDEKNQALQNGGTYVEAPQVPKKNTISKEGCIIYPSAVIFNITYGYIPRFACDISNVTTIMISSESGSEDTWKILENNVPIQEKAPFVNVAPYSFSRDSLVADLLILEDHPNDVSSFQNPFVVDYVSQGLDSEGNVTKVIHGYSSSDKITYTVNGDEYTSNSKFREKVDALEEGFVVAPLIYKNEVTDIEIVYVPIDYRDEPLGTEEIFGPTHWSDTQDTDHETILSRDETKRSSGDGSGLGSIQLLKYVGAEQKFIKLQYRASVEGVRQDLNYMFNAKTATVTLCERNPDGTFTFTPDIPVNAMLPGDVVVAKRSGSSVGILGTVFAFRDNSR